MIFYVDLIDSLVFGKSEFLNTHSFPTNVQLCSTKMQAKSTDITNDGCSELDECKVIRNRATSNVPQQPVLVTFTQDLSKAGPKYANYLSDIVFTTREILFIKENFFAPLRHKLAVAFLEDLVREKV